jgi:aminomethyltransferase
VVTSGNFSPILGHGIALALLHTDVVGDVIIDVRGSELPGRVVPTPFVAKK